MPRFAGFVSLYGTSYFTLATGDQISTKPDDPDDLTVWVNGHSEGTFFHDLVKSQFEIQKKKYPNTYYAFPYNEYQLISSLRQIRQKGKIQRLHYFSHGLAGEVQLAGLKADLLHGDPLENIFAPGARFDIHSCLTGNGKKGEAYLKALGERFLSDGGQVTASRLLLFPAPSEVLQHFSGARTESEIVASDVVGGMLIRPIGAFAPVLAGLFYPDTLTSEEFIVLKSIRTVQIQPRKTGPFFNTAMGPKNSRKFDFEDRSGE